ncbi:MAG: class I SAM-dependent methyltransferase [Betaproteobacteria bacterium]|jgi:SAM-dependent methyltransferase|nr:class I SAM-dependent methyltransferase [Betaproteobacteria bacterium]MBK8106485.1 class I SAM-dependent methyltransferase [Betaproteobacteria bacterium]
MTTKRFTPERQSAWNARYEAQRIAFGPVVFQCVRHAWKHGMLDAVARAGGAGITTAELAATGRWTAYALKVVLESCLTGGVVRLAEGRWVLDKAGGCVLGDRMTQVNIDWIHDVCWKGLFELDGSLAAGKPLGLQAFGDWPTLYEGMSQLPEPAKTSWFAFDHFYSDTSFPLVLPDVFATAPRRILDVGANTGRFTLAALAYSDAVEMHLVDLPQQLAAAEAALVQAGLRSRATLHPMDLLDPQTPLPAGMDVVWMSQFLSCFSETEIETLLRRAEAALAPQGQVLILDTLWDRQQHDIATYCLINTSPYFTTMANGNSKIYSSTDYLRLAQAAGLELVTARDGIGYCHSLLRLRRAGAGQAG